MFDTFFEMTTGTENRKQEKKVFFDKNILVFFLLLCTHKRKTTGDGVARVWEELMMSSHAVSSFVRDH